MKNIELTEEGKFLNSGIDFRDSIVVAKEFSAEDDFNSAIVIDDCWMKFATASLVSFKEKMFLTNSFFFEDSVFLSCTFYKKVVIDRCYFRGSLKFISCLFLDDFILTDSTLIEKSIFNDNSFKSDISVKGNQFKNGTDLLDHEGKPYRNSFERKKEIII